MSINLEVDVLDLYVKESGNRHSSRLMVFLHGGGVSGWMWNRQTAYFQDSLCLVPDLPGHGRSAGGRPFSISRTAEEICDLVSASADGREIVVVGFSLGAQIVVEMLSRRPDLIDCAVVNSALLRPMPWALPLIVPSVALSFPLAKYRWFAKWQAGPLHVSDDDFESYYADSRRTKRDTLVSVLKENMSYALPPHIKDSKAQLLVTVGEKERGVMKRSAEDLVSLRGRATGIVFPGIGHGAPLANPALFNRVVEDWMLHGSIPDDVFPIPAVTSARSRSAGGEGEQG